MNTTITITESGAIGDDLYATDERWVCGFEDEVQIRLGIYAKVEDFYEATGDEQFKSHPFVVDFEILPHDPAESGPALKDADWIDEMLADDVGYDVGYDAAELRREAVRDYGGGVPVSRQLAPELDESVDHVLDAHNSEPRFACREDAVAHARAALEAKAPGIMMLVGFVLDQPYNGMGDTGWDLLRPAALGE